MGLGGELLTVVSHSVTTIMITLIPFESLRKGPKSTFEQLLNLVLNDTKNHCRYLRLCPIRTEMNEKVGVEERRGVGVGSVEGTIT